MFTCCFGAPHGGCPALTYAIRSTDAVRHMAHPRQRQVLRSAYSSPNHIFLKLGRAALIRFDTVVDLTGCWSHLSSMPKTEKPDIELLRTWTLSPAATLGSAVRAKGILQEIKSRLPFVSKKALSLDGPDLILAMSADEKTAFNTAAVIISRALEGIELLPIIPREIQDILTIKAGERHRWLADGRLTSAGTRTVRLNGRARQITFHVFDPKVVEDLLDRGAVDEWRVEDAEAKAEKRQQAAYRAKLTRSLKPTRKAKNDAPDKPDQTASELKGWEEFDIAGLLR